MCVHSDIRAEWWCRQASIPVWVCFVLCRSGIHVLNLPSQSSKIWPLGSNSRLKTSSRCWSPRYVTKQQWGMVSKSVLQRYFRFHGWPLQIEVCYHSVITVSLSVISSVMINAHRGFLTLGKYRARTSDPWLAHSDLQDRKQLNLTQL